MNLVDLILRFIDRVCAADEADLLARRIARDQARQARIEAQRARAAASRLGHP